MTAAEPAASRSSGPVTPLTGVLMALVSVFAFSALIVLLAYAPDLRNGDDGGAQVLSKSAIGFAGIAEALRLSREPVVVNRAPLPEGRRVGLLVITPNPLTRRDDIEALSFGGPVLVVLPKWSAIPDLTHRGWVRNAGLLEPALFDPNAFVAEAGLARRPGRAPITLHGRLAPFPPAQMLQSGPIDHPQVITAPRWIPVLSDAAGGVVLARDPRRPLYILSDPDLMNTQGVRDERTLATALTILRTLRAQDGAVIFDVRLNGLGRERSVLRLLLQPPFLGATLCLAAAAALAGIQALFRFGPVQRGGRAIPLGKTALVNNTAAMIRLAGREHRLGDRYADLTADIAARAVGAPRGLGGEALAGFLDRLSVRRRSPGSFSDLGRDARIAQSPERLVGASERLYRWRVEMTGEDPS